MSQTTEYGQSCICECEWNLNDIFLLVEQTPDFVVSPWQFFFLYRLKCVCEIEYQQLLRTQNWHLLYLELKLHFAQLRTRKAMQKRIIALKKL